MSSCIAPDPKNHRLCEECEKGGYEVEVLVLTTYGGRDTHIVNLDGTIHVHFDDEAKYRWSQL